MGRVFSRKTRVITILGLLGFFLGTAWPQQSRRLPVDPDETTAEGQEAPAARQAWFMRGRRSATGSPPAIMRQRAFQQRQAMLQALARQSGVQANAILPLSSGSGPQWQPIGPAPLISDPTGNQSYGLVAGRVTAVAVDQSDGTGNTVYIAAAYGGVWKSTNAANPSPSAVTWAPLIDDQATLSIGAVAVSPDGHTVLAGTGEPNNAGDSYYGLGILRSTANGAPGSWTLISSADNGANSFHGLGISRIVFNTSNPQQVVAAVAHASVTEGSDPGNTVGLYYSNDGGASWHLATVFDPGNAQVIAGSVNGLVYSPGNNTFYAAYRAHGYYQSTNGGQSWTRLANQPDAASITLAQCPTGSANLTACPLYRGELSVNAQTGELFTWFVGINSSGSTLDGGVWKTTVSAGSTAAWTQLSDTGISSCGEGQGCGVGQGTYDLYILAVPHGGSSDLYAGAVNVYKSTSEGAFNNISHVYGCNPVSMHPDYHGTDYSQSNPQIIYFGNDGGIYRTLSGFSLTGGCNASQASFISSLNQNIGSLTQFMSFSQHPSNASVVLGGTQDNGSPATNSAGGNTTWGSVNLGDGGFNEIDPTGTVFFTSNTDVSIQNCISPNGDPTLCAGGFAPLVTQGTNFPDHGDFYTPYILDPADASKLIIGTCRVWRGSSSDSANWSASSFANALSNKLDQSNGGAGTACAAAESFFVSALAAGGSNPGPGSQVIYAGMASGVDPNTGAAIGGNIWVTTNAAGGPGTWADRTAGINPNHFSIGSVAVDPGDASGNTAYLTIMGFTGGAGHVFKTTNAGASWQDITANLPDAPADSIVVNPLSGSDLLVGTDVGVFRSTNGGASWAPFGTFFPNVVTNKLRIFNSGGQLLVRASTHGRGIWQADLLAKDFAFTMAANQVSAFPNQMVNFSGTITSQGGYNNTVTLSCVPGAGPVPDGGCMPNPASGTAPFPFTLAAAGSTPQDYSFSLQGTGNDTNATTHGQPLTLRVIDYSLSMPAPASLTLVPNTTSQAASLQVSALGQFNQPVTFTCAGLPFGATCNFLPAAVTPAPGQPQNVAVTITANNSALGGSYPVSIMGTTAGQPAPRSTNLTVVIQDFALSSVPAHQQAYPAQVASYSGTVTAIQGYSSPVSLTCVAGQTAPPATCGIVPANPIVPTSAFTLTASYPANNPNNCASPPCVGDFLFQVLGSGSDAGQTTRPLPLGLSVVDFALGALSANSIFVNQSSISQPVSFQLVPSGSFSLPVTLDCPGVPAGIACQFNTIPAPAVVQFSGKPLNVALTLTATNAAAAETTPNLSVTASTSNPSRPGGAELQNFSLTVTSAAGTTDIAISDAAPETPTTAHLVGAPLTLMFAVSNNGSAVTNANAYINFPQALMVQSANISSGGACAGAGTVTATLSCPIGAMSSPGNQTITLVVVPDFVRSISAEAFVNSELGDSDLSNNSLTVVRQVRPRPLAIRGLPAILP